MASQFCIRVGENIRKYRKEAGITLKELGQLLRPTVNTLEVGACNCPVV